MSRGGKQFAKLLRKVCHVEGIRGPATSAEWTRLPVYTLTFANPPGVDSLGVRIDCGDVVKIRIPNFKPTSYSMSAERPGEFDVTYKLYPGGMCSGYLDSLKVGDDISVYRTGYKQRRAGSHVGFIAYGVGITEALPIAAAELAKPEPEQVRLLWANKTCGDQFWHKEIESMQAAHPTRFSVVHILSREKRHGSLYGRCSSAVLAQVFDRVWGTAADGPNAANRNDARFLTVGTESMMEETKGMLREIGYSVPGQHALLR